MVLSEAVNKIALQAEKRIFAGFLIFTIILYSGITFWLNAIRSNAAIWFVWILIIQLLLYCWIFVLCYHRSIDCGYKRGILIFIGLALLGRVNDWELIIIPLVAIIMLVISAKNKNQQLVKD